MIMMWLSSWLYYALGGSHDSWWAAPFIFTSVLLAIAELVIEAATIGMLIEEQSKKSS